MVFFVKAKWYHRYKSLRHGWNYLIWALSKSFILFIIDCLFHKKNHPKVVNHYIICMILYRKIQVCYILTPQTSTLRPKKQNTPASKKNALSHAQKEKTTKLVGGFSPPHLKNMFLKMGSSSPIFSAWKFRPQKYVKMPPHMAILLGDLFGMSSRDPFNGSWWPPTRGWSSVFGAWIAWHPENTWVLRQGLFP